MKIFRKTKMKIFVAVSVMTLFSTIGLPVAKEVIPKAKADTYYSNGLGYSTNVIKQEVGEFLPVSPILRKEFLRSDDLNMVRVPLNKKMGDEITELSYNSIATKMKNKYEGSISGGIGYNAFTVNAYTNFSSAISAAKETYTSQYYNIKIVENKLYSLSLENSAYFSQVYEDQFNPYYLNALEELKNAGTATAYNNFFDTYGTHVVIGGIYGGDFKSYYSIYSTTEAFTDEIKDKFEAGINAAYAKKSNIGADIHYSISNIEELDSSQTYVNSHFHSRGGADQQQGYLNEGKGYYNSWLNSITEDNAVLIDYTAGGLLPLWKALPSQYSSLESAMSSYFNSYAQVHQRLETAALKEKDLLLENTYRVQEESVRGEEKTITDSSRWDNWCDVVAFSQVFNLKTQVFKTYGFTKVRIEFNFEAKRVDDADTRLVFLYQNANKEENENNKKLYEASFNDITTSAFKAKFFDSDLIAIDDLSQNMCVIRYRATGMWDDDWINRRVRMSLTFIK